MNWSTERIRYAGAAGVAGGLAWLVPVTGRVAGPDGGRLLDVATVLVLLVAPILLAVATLGLRATYGDEYEWGEFGAGLILGGLAITTLTGVTILLQGIAGGSSPPTVPGTGITTMALGLIGLWPVAVGSLVLGTAMWRNDLGPFQAAVLLVVHFPLFAAVTLPPGIVPPEFPVVESVLLQSAFGLAWILLGVHLRRTAGDRPDRSASNVGVESPSDGD